MTSAAATVQQYLDALPPDRRALVGALRDTVNARLPDGYAEGMQYGMIGWFVPHAVHPAGYHCDPRQPLPFAGLASQKAYVSLYLMSIYGHEPDRAWFEAAWRGTGQRLDMGRACVRVRRLEEVPLHIIGEAIARVPADEYIARSLAAVARR
jgi:hypothetical protein